MLLHKTTTTLFLAFTSARFLNYSLRSPRRCTGPCGGDECLICATVCFLWAAAVFSPPPMRCANHRRIYCGADTFVEGVWGFWLKHMLNTEGGEKYETRGTLIIRLPILQKLHSTKEKSASFISIYMQFQNNSPLRAHKGH